jgi:hypothetical protein
VDIAAISAEDIPMTRAGFPIVFLLVVSGEASAWVRTGNQRLDHALWPEHDPKLVVAGEIVAVNVKELEPALNGPHREVDFRFKVEGVILGDKAYEGKTLAIPATSFIWPEVLVPLRKGSFCVLVLRKRAEKEDFFIYSVVPAISKHYSVAKDSLEARKVLAAEVLAQLNAEKSEERQRVLLLQLAPVLTKEDRGAVEPFLQAKNAWLRRAALAALIYSTEEEKYLEMAARDTQAFFTGAKERRWVEDRNEEVICPERIFFFHHYFFLDKVAWRLGTRWDEKEADKHSRILHGMLRFEIIDKKVAKQLTGE